VRGFATREFQLMLLRRMADFQPLLVEDAYTAIGATRADYMAAHNRWQTMLHSRRAPRGLSLLKAVLGPPLSDRAVPVGDLNLTAYLWRLPMWPDLRWEALVEDGGGVLNSWLVRPSPLTAMPPVDRLAPWSIVVNDAVTGYEGAEQVNPDVPVQWLVRLGDKELWFVHGLLQQIRPRSRQDQV
jgi:hypothetical protein